MSQRRTRKSLSQPSTSSTIIDSQDIEEQFSSTQIDSGDNLSKQEHDHHVANVVKYILAADRAKTTIVRSAISKAVNCPGKNFRAVFKSAQDVLKDVFGYKLVDVEKGRFILCNMLKNEHLNYDESTQSYYVLLFLVLTHIYMSGEVCTEASLYDFLLKLEIISQDNFVNEYFGNVLELINVKFVKDKYIKIDKTEHDEEGESELRWGIRANEELSVRAVMEFVSEVYGGKDMQSWPEQYKGMIDREKAEEKNTKQNAQNASREEQSSQERSAEEEDDE